MRVGITGHQKLEQANAWQWVSEVMHNRLAAMGEAVAGVSCLAAGADQLFAELVLRLGGTIIAIVPFHGYERTFGGGNLKRFQELVKQAESVETLRAGASDEESYFAAGKRVVELSDTVFAVWDGTPAKGLGGTGDVVNWGRANGKTIFQFDPINRLVNVLPALSKGC